MRRRLFVALIVLMATGGAELLLRAADEAPAAAPKPGAAAPKTQSAYTVPRTPDGQPDLGGTWSGSDWALVPVQKFRSVITTNRTGDVPAYWYEGWDKKPVRPYMLLDPADGLIPIRPDAAKTARLDEWSDDSKLDNIQSPSELDQWSRCITRGPIPVVPTSYNAGTQIVQTPGSVAVLTEMIHETRVIHLGGQHPPRNVRLWLGDSRGHWEGDTLVVDITNFAEPSRLVPSVFKTTGIYTGPGENLHVIERFKRVAADAIDYQVTVEDPTMFTRPFTLGFTLKKDPEYEIYEYACQEGNHFIENVLTAARLKEKKARAAGKK